MLDLLFLQSEVWMFKRSELFSVQTSYEMYLAIKFYLPLLVLVIGLHGYFMCDPSHRAAYCKRYLTYYNVILIMNKKILVLN